MKADQPRDNLVPAPSGLDSHHHNQAQSGLVQFASGIACSGIHAGLPVGKLNTKAVACQA